MNKKTLRKIIFLSILGIIVSAYLLKVYYSDGSQICDLGGTFSCSTLKNSQYAQVLGYPVALYGLLGYLLIGLIAVFRYKKEEWLRGKWMRRIFSQHNLFYVSFVALIFSVYLTFLEFFVIKALCLFCLVSFAIIIVITVYTYRNFRVKENSYK